MWKSDKSNQPFTAPQPDRGNGNHEDIQVADADWHETPSARSTATIDDLRTQPGFGVVMAASDLQTTTQAPAPNSIGSRMSFELDALSRRERQVREMKELATYRVVDLTTDQLRRILEFMA